MKPKKEENLKERGGSQRVRAWLLGGLAALIVAGVLLPADSIKAQEGAGLPVAVLTLLLAGAFCGLALVGRIDFVRLGVVEWSVVVLLACIGISTFATLKTGVRPAINMAWQWIGLGMAFLLARQLVRTAAECRAIVALMLALTAFQSIYSGWQLAVELPRERARYEREKAADPNTPLPGLGYVSATTREDFEARLYSNEPQGSFVLTNSLAGVLAAWMVIGAGVAVNILRQGISPPRVLLPLTIGLLAMSACLYQTHSRTAQLATAVGGVLLLATSGGFGLRRGGAWLIAAMGVSLAAGLVLLLATHWAPLAGPRLSLVYRLEYWQATWKLVRDHWLLGCGPGHFADVYTQYMLPHYRETISDPHNFLMEVLATAGIPAALALIVALAGFFVTMARGGSTADPTMEGQPPAKIEKEDCTAPRSALRGITLGATAGVLLAYLLGEYFFPVVHTAYHNNAVVYGLFGGAAFVWCLWPWVERGTLPAKLLAVGAALLLLNLLGAGGIGYPGVASNMWLLMALGMTLAQRPSNVLPASRGMVVAAFLVTLVLAAGCQWTAVNPVVRSRMYLDLAAYSFEQARANRSAPAQATQHLAEGRTWLTEGAHSDPWDAAVRREMAQRHLLAWLESGSEERRDAFMSAQETWLKLAHASAAAHKLSGDWFLQAFRATEDPNMAQKAAASYRQATARYPANSLYYAQLAWAEHLAGNEDGAAEAAAEALRLDSLNPQQDRKLGYDKVQLGGDPQVKDKSPAELMRSLIENHEK